MTEISELVGKVFTSVRNVDDDLLVFKGEQGNYEFYHDQNCCESVYIAEIIGDLEDLVNVPILLAEERWNEAMQADAPEFSCESYTWTFYEFRTIKGSVTVRWLGASNGYYSESVEFRRLK